MPFPIVNARHIRNNVGFNTGGIRGFGDTAVYATGAQYAAAMEYCGSRWMRVEINGGETALASGIQAGFVNAGYNNPNLKVQLLANGYLAQASTYPWTAVQAPLMLDYATNNSQWHDSTGKSVVKAIEGPNEMNSNDFAGGHTAGGEQCVVVDTTTPIQSYIAGPTGSAPDPASDTAFRGWTQAMSSWRTAHSTALAGVELLSPTYSGYYFFPWTGDQNVSSLVDFGCYHSYVNSLNAFGSAPGSGSPCAMFARTNNPGCDMSTFYMSAAQGIMGSQTAPMVISETKAGPGWAADHISQARSDMLWLMDFFAINGHRLLYFELLADDGNGGGMFGFFNNDFTTPRPSAVCLHNVMNILSLNKSYQHPANNTDTAGFTPSYNTGGLTVTSPVAPSATGGVMVMPKSDGSTIIAVWNEPTVDTGGTSVTPAASSMFVNFGSSQTYHVYDISGSGGNATMTPTATTTPYLSGTGTGVTVNLYGLPVLIELAPPTITRSTVQVLTVNGFTPTINGRLLQI